MCADSTTSQSTTLVSIKLYWKHRYVQEDKKLFAEKDSQIPERWAPINAKICSKIPFLQEIVSNLEHVKNPEILHIPHKIFDDVVKFYITWCSDEEWCQSKNIFKNHRIATELLSMPSCYIYNLILLADFMKDNEKTDQMIKFGIFPDDDNNDVMDSIHDLPNFFRTKICSQYLMHCERTFCVTRNAYQQLWYILGYRPRVAELFWPSQVENMLSVAKISRKQFNSFKACSYAQAVDYLKNLSVIANYRSTHNCFISDLPLTIKHITWEFTDNFNEKKDLLKTQKAYQNQLETTTAELENKKYYMDEDQLDNCKDHMKSLQKILDDVNKKIQAVSNKQT